LSSESAKVLILSYAFAPSIGGIETVSGILAHELAARGYEVVVVTQTSNLTFDRNDGFKVVRLPSLSSLLRWTRWADAVIQSNISLRLAWPLFTVFLRKPFVLVHHTPITRPHGARTWRDRAKRILLRRPSCFSVSRYLVETVGAPSGHIPNPYADNVFRKIPDVRRAKDLLFVGRLVPAKGLDVLLNSLAILRDRQLLPNLSIVGTGPEERSLRRQAHDLGIMSQVEFLGPCRGEDLAVVMNQHRVLVVPSRPQPPETFGIVVVEAIACGCVVVGSRHGGLPESIGPCGLLFENENPHDLANCLSEILQDHVRQAEMQTLSFQHLTAFTRSAVVERYRQEISRAIGGTKSS
jgi:glycosyltransferase involved in cell wall biosynthesis